MNNEIIEWARSNNISAQALYDLHQIIDPNAPRTPQKTGTSEARVQSMLQITAPKIGGALWRNNNGAMKSDDGRMVRFGLGNISEKISKHWKSADLIGITPVRATYVGQQFGVFTGVEVKKPGWSKPTNERERAQSAFLTNVKALGGIGLFAQSVEDYTNEVYPR